MTVKKKSPARSRKVVRRSVADKRTQPAPKHPERDWRAHATAAFPAPGPEPKTYQPRDEEDRARLQNELHAWEMRALIHRAVHINDPKARADLAGRVSWFLQQGWQLTPDTRRWLSWVLSCLLRNDAIPHLARGNAIKSRERTEFIKKLVRVIAGLPDGAITLRLKEAARIMSVSYEKVRAAYYSDTYRLWESMFRMEQDFLRNNPPP